MANADEKGYVNLLGRRYKDDEQLRLHAQQVADTLASPGWQVLRDLLDDVHAQYFKNLILNVRGPVASQAEMARATGFLAGIEQPQIAADAFAIALTRMAERNQAEPQ